MKTATLHLPATLLALLIHQASATTLPTIELRELTRDADLVVKVQVLSGETLGVGESSCGAKYTALVEESFKGSSAGATIEFGNHYGYEIGNRYILFLVKPGTAHEPMMSTNSMYMQEKAEFQRRCVSLLSRSTVMHSGYGALRIGWTSEFQYKDGVRVPTRYIALPETTRTTPSMASEYDQYSGLVWVRLEEMSQLIHELAK